MRGSTKDQVHSQIFSYPANIQHCFFGYITIIDTEYQRCCAKCFYRLVKHITAVFASAVQHDTVIFSSLLLLSAVNNELQILRGLEVRLKTILKHIEFPAGITNSRSIKGHARIISRQAALCALS